MNNKEICEKIAELENRVSRMERGGNVELPKQRTLELGILLPKAKIGGLRFNETKVIAVFDLKEDGWYQSRNLLFLSARNAEYDNSRDILVEYLESAAFRGAVAISLIGIYKPSIGNIYTADDVEVSLPEEQDGIKKYNGVVTSYWLKGVNGETHFCIAFPDTVIYSCRASSVIGVSLMLRLKEE
jgi:hypothetical protein